MLVGLHLADCSFIASTDVMFARLLHAVSATTWYAEDLHVARSLS